MNELKKIMKTEFKEIELGEICEIYQPKTISQKALIENGEYLVYGANGIIGKYDKYNHENSEVLITCRGATCGTINFSKPFSWITGNSMVISPRENNIEKKYLFFLLKGFNMDKVISGSAQPQITRSPLIKIKIPIPFKDNKPDLETQKKIVEKLELVEKLKENREKSDELTKEYLNSVFLDMFGDPRTNPKGFETESIKKYLIKSSSINPEKEFGENKFKYIDIASVSGKTGKIEKYNEIIGNEAPSRARRLIIENDIIVSTVRPNLNAVGIVNKELNNQVCSTGFHILRTNKYLNYKYLYLICRTSYFIDSLMKVSKGANYPAVGGKDIENVIIPIPPIDLQNKFAQIVQEVEELKKYQEKSKEEINNLYNKLMQQAFKGEL